MIDRLISIISVTAFITYAVLLVFAVRKFGQSGILTILKNRFLFVALIVIMIWTWLLGIHVLDRLVYIALSLFIYWALSIGYILCFFGLPLSSVRIQNLLVIAGYGSAGVTKQQLTKNHSNMHSMKIRLHRLESSGEIIQEGNTYRIRSNWSYFMIHNRLLLYVIALYKPFIP